MTEKIDENNNEFQLLYKKILNIVSSAKNTELGTTGEDITVSIDIPSNSSLSDTFNNPCTTTTYTDISKITIAEEIVEDIVENIVEDTDIHSKAVSECTDEKDNLSQTESS
jgi:hypothetical protein